nr:MAG: hypothetical protein [Bacteriophage sp.]
MAEIATWSAILNKTGLGKTSNECPTKAELLALNNGKDSNVDKVIVISNAASYGNNECVKLEDINAEQWIYTFQWDPNGNPSFNAPATGGTYPFGSYASNRVKQVNGVNTTISQSLANDTTKTSEGSWYTTDYDGNKGRIVPNNTSTNSKSITVTWTQKYSGKTLQATFTQAAGRKVYSSWSYNCRVDKTSFSYSGGQSNVTAKSASRTYTWNGQGSSYTESETATVRVSSPASISGNSISIPSNSGSARNFTVTFDFPTATDQTISISQEGGQVTYVYHLSIDPTTKNVPGTGSSGFSLTVNANYDKYINGTYVENIRTLYTSEEVVEGTSSDITVFGRTSSGCRISVAPNPNSSPRTFKIKFTYNTATPVYLTITQNSAEVTYPSSGMVFEHSTQQDSGYKTSTLSIGTVEGKGGNISFYIKSYRSRYVNGSLSSTEAIKPTLILPSGVTETITNVSGYYFKVTITIPEHSKPASRTLTIRANQPNGLDIELVQTVQQSASTYEFYIRENSGDSLSTSLTYSGWPSSDSSYNRPVIVYSRKNGNQFLNWALSSNVDWVTISGSGAGAIFRVATNNSSSSRTGIITFTQGESNKTCTLTIVQEAGDVYEFYITDSDGNGHYADFTFSAPPDGLTNKHVLNLISTHNGSPLSIDDVEVVRSEIVEKLIGLVLTPDTQSPFRFRASITTNGNTERTAADTYRQKASGKTVIFRVLQEAKIHKFRLELSLNISNGNNDQDTWGLFDTANRPHTSAFMYDMSPIREGIIVDSVEGKITVNSIQSITKDIGVGYNVYVWAYNSVRGSWLSIGDFRIEDGNNTHHWDVSWPT